jgi:hypothetical protein
MTGVGRDSTVDEVQNVEVDAKEMEAFWTSLEAFLTSSSESPTCSSMETAADITPTTTANKQFGARRGRRRRAFKVVLGQDVVCDGHRR